MNTMQTNKLTIKSIADYNNVIVEDLERVFELWEDKNFEKVLSQIRYIIWCNPGMDITDFLIEILAYLHQCKEEENVRVGKMTESNFHKWNEQIYYEIINLICSNEGIKYKDLLTILDKQKERLHLKYMPDEKYHKAIADVIMDLIEHDVLEGPIILIPQSSLKDKEHTPIGTDLFEYLRDKGVI